MKFKGIKRIIRGLLLMTCLWGPNVASAEIFTVEADGIYSMGDGEGEENQAIAKERARVDAIRLAGEQASVYVENSNEVSQGMLTRDDIKLLSATILQVKSYDYHPVVEGDEIIYRCHLIATVDTDSMKGLIKNGRLQLEMEDSLRKYQEENERLSKENELLNLRYKLASVAQKMQLGAMKRKNNREFLANKYAKEGCDLQRKQEYQGAIEAYNKSIVLNPNNAIVYSNMGYACLELEQNERAKSLFEKAITLDPDRGEAYSALGIIYYGLGQYKKAISFCEKAIELKEANSGIYLMMGDLYERLGDKEKAREYTQMSYKLMNNEINMAPSN